MGSFIFKQMRWRFLFGLGLLVLTAASFWMSSRYPALDDKAMMGGAINLEDPLSFEAHWPVDAGFPTWKKIFLTTLNWLHTNRQGMFFGVLMGSIVLTQLKYLKSVSFKNPFLNSLAGLVIGSPLGVCVNCAAPIAKGLYSGGVRAETMLAAMLASPTFNVVVLTMLFSIFPFYIAITKVALSLAIILIAVPVICHWLPAEQKQLPETDRFCPIPTFESESAEPFMASVKGFIRDFGTSLWYIIRLTVPLMFLAGFLGAVVATLIPIGTLSSIQVGLLGLFVIAVIGIFLPVPMAFDVVICGALFAGGLAVGSVTTLLITLGIFSVYSFFIVTQSISLRAASSMTAVIVVLAVGAGLGTQQWHKVKTKQALELLSADSSDPSLTDVYTVIASEPATTGLNPKKEMVENDAAFDVQFEKVPFQTKSPKAEKTFTRLEAHQIGIDKPIEFSFKDMWPPFWEGRSITSGDIDRDGDPDIILASTEKGLYFYLNNGAGQFTRKLANMGDLSQLPIFNAVLVDLNNDGWLDLFLATYKKGNHIVWNKEGQYDFENVTSVKNRDNAILSLALSFGDVDQDGDLDAVLGNWAAGWYRRIPGEESRNRIVLNENDGFTGEAFKDLTGLPGETLTTLFTDINADGYQDLLVGNDFELPDVYYYGDGNGNFSRIRGSDNVIPFTTTTTMSIKNSDLNNDLKPEIYVAQIAGRATGVSKRLKMQPIDQYCDGIKNPEDRRICLENMDIKTWYKSGNNFDPSYAHKCLELQEPHQAECKAMLVKDLAIQAEDSSICGLIKADQSQARAYCDVHFQPIRQSTKAEIQDNYPQINGRNVLLIRQEDGRYIDTSKESGLDVGGWSWDTKIDDFDNDEWPDVYITNGTWVPNEFTPSNMYYSNQASGTFIESARDFGLEDYLMTAAAAKLDIDNDGDLDLVTIPVNGPVQFYKNNTQIGNAIQFEIQDEIGNHFGIGTKIIIRYGANGQRQQIREIQLGGGFQSFDGSFAHFGLGEFDEVSGLTIHWSNGGVSEFDETLAGGAKYIIKRKTSI